ncbi:hypothetical protein P167DRAFT_286104 [Morchella conica CCBAS932]|uniref:Secreted protein n=1 Tax=Morchella conica CCBAS932 TaxID=1392247 RepID=A0A3N4KVI3_9PEZI|nr:hypothetical protein P167DRAFT_286104 [Morchella conica CCBAS932]
MHPRAKLMRDFLLCLFWLLSLHAVFSSECGVLCRKNNPSRKAWELRFRCTYGPIYGFINPMLLWGSWRNFGVFGLVPVNSCMGRGYQR